MLTIAGRHTSQRDYCDGVSRRDRLRIGSLAALGTVGSWALPDLLRAESLSGRKSPKSVIMIYLVGNKLYCLVDLFPGNKLFKYQLPHLNFCHNDPLCEINLRYAEMQMYSNIANFAHQPENPANGTNSKHYHGKHI